MLQHSMMPQKGCSVHHSDRRRFVPSCEVDGSRIYWSWKTSRYSGFTSLECLTKIFGRQSFPEKGHEIQQIRVVGPGGCFIMFHRPHDHLMILLIFGGLHRRSCREAIWYRRRARQQGSIGLTGRNVSLLWCTVPSLHGDFVWMLHGG